MENSTGDGKQLSLARTFRRPQYAWPATWSYHKPNALAGTTGERRIPGGGTTTDDSAAGVRRRKLKRRRLRQQQKSKRRIFIQEIAPTHPRKLGKQEREPSSSDMEMVTWVWGLGVGKFRGAGAFGENQRLAGVVFRRTMSSSRSRRIRESRNRATVVAEKRGAERGRWVRRTTMTPTQLCDVSRLAGPPSEEPKLEANADWPHCPGRWRFIGDSTVGLVTWPPRRCPVSHTDPF